MNNISKVLEISIALSSEKDYKKILTKIVDESMNITNCDAATLYLKQDDKLYFYISRNKTLDIFQGDGSQSINLPPVMINEDSVSGYVAYKKESINTHDIYNDPKFHFEGPKKYDSMTGYHTKSMLVIPLINREEEVLGVLQLINSMDKDGNIIAFDNNIQDIIYALASLSAISLSNKLLYEEIEQLLDSFIKAMVTAIDSRTPYNANHTINVARLCDEFVNYLNNNGYSISANDKDELVMAAMCHDIGKIITPLNVLNKATRLEGKIDLMKMRFKVIESELKCKYLNNEIDLNTYNDEYKLFKEYTDFVISLDTKGYITPNELDYIKKIYEKEYETSFGILKIIEENEILDASIVKGTLTSDERKEIEMHVVYTNRILNDIRFGKKYQNVKKIASSHHEYLDGSGYPNHIKDDVISTLIRIITICDVYESLTSTDRPYKKPMPKEIACKILGEMVNEGKLDNTLVLMFKKYVGENI